MRILGLSLTMIGLGFVLGWMLFKYNPHFPPTIIFIPLMLVGWILSR